MKAHIVMRCKLNRQNTSKCEVCGKMYQKLNKLVEHVSKVHNQLTGIEIEENDYVYNYTRTTTSLVSIKLVLDNAIKYGNGQQVMLCYKFMFLYCRDAGFNKYAYGLLETIAQTTALLSPRAAHDLIWNRFVNTTGHADSNIPIDMHVEHCNRPLKLDVTTFRGEITEKTLHRVSRSVHESEVVVQQYDRINKVHRPSGKHKNVDREQDIMTLVNALNNKQVFQNITGRSHRQFLQVKANPLSTIDMKDLQKWIKKSVTKFRTRHYYKF